jgi:hypothetical protein
MGVPATKTMDVKVAAGTSIISAIAGAVGHAVAIISLTYVDSDYMLTVATICIGAALLFFAGASATRYSRLVENLGAGRLVVTEVWRGVTGQFLGGAAGIALGILGLMGLDPVCLRCNRLRSSAPAGDRSVEPAQ